MLFAISGSQGSGKSTTIESLYKEGFPIVQRKTSRSILEEWGVTLSEVNNDRPLTIKFQDEILKRKFEDEREAALSRSEICFTERTYADLFAYALIAIGKDNEYSDWINDYYERCQRYQSSYKHIFFLPQGKFNLEADGVRGANKHYSKLVDTAIINITKQMRSVMDPLTFQPINPELTQVLDVGVEQRKQEILGKISLYLTKPTTITEEV